MLHSFSLRTFADDSSPLWDCGTTEGLMTRRRRLRGLTGLWSGASVITTKTVSPPSKPDIIADNFPLPIRHLSRRALPFVCESVRTLAGQMKREV